MVPGYSGIDCRVAEFRYQLKLVETPHRQFVANPCPSSPSIRSMSPSLRQQLGTLLVHAGERLQGAQAVITESLDSTQTVAVSATT